MFRQRKKGDSGRLTQTLGVRRCAVAGLGRAHAKRARRVGRQGAPVEFAYFGWLNLAAYL